MFTNPNVPEWYVQFMHFFYFQKCELKNINNENCKYKSRWNLHYTCRVYRSYASHLLAFDSDKLQLCLMKYFRRQVLAVNIFLAAFVMKCVVAVLLR